MVLASIIVYLYAMVGSDPYLVGRAAAPMGFQLACWIILFALISATSPGGVPRVSDPGILMLVWSGVYFLYPSIVWLHGGYIHFSEVLSNDVGVLLFWLHGLFMLGFGFGYIALRRSRGRVRTAERRGRLPSGALLLAIPLAFLLLVALVRLIAGGSVVPGQTYADQWFAAQETVESARTSGGLSFVGVQILSKVWFYPILALGIGAGLLLVGRMDRRQGKASIMLLLLGGVLLMLLLGWTTRSGSLILIVIILVFVDLVRGPIPWRPLILFGVIGAVMFISFGYFRAYSNLGVEVGIRRAYESYQSEGRETALVEFTSMLGKEAWAVRLFSASDAEGMMYLAQGSLSFLPGQLLPEELQHLSTGELLSSQLLGPAGIRGAGVGGAIVGDGYRLAGAAGVPLLGAILGVLFGYVHAWLNKDRGLAGGPVVLKAALAAGFYAWAFLVIRGNLASIVSAGFYYVVVVWLLFRALGSPSSRWLQPVQRQVAPK